MCLEKVSKGDWTKRLLLRLSDPLGLISPFTIRDKTILQVLWGIIKTGTHQFLKNLYLSGKFG
jgi:hypothetical protein